ncbi:BglG family transcription antiterminator [Caviibacter abscessus]|uniref:BglG family transcription antiterminator n=1 Tax=Caviibacter abscessus TaxID=1766719 RepID=UPI00083254D5|nr:PRD domain-containing protein [Caviibacter abscessus]
MRDKYIKIYDILKDKKNHTSFEISKKINMSDKTTRNILKELKKILNNNDCDLISVRGVGYRIDGNLDDIYKLLYEKEKIPTTKSDRIKFLFEILVVQNRLIKLDDICEKIYTSPSTISSDIKELKVKLSEYNLKLVSKPYHGIRIVGRETDIRSFLINYYSNHFNENIFVEPDEKFKIILEFTKRFVFMEDITLSDLSFFYLVITIYVWINRMKLDLKIEKNIFYSINYFEKKEIVKKYIFELLERLNLKINITENELKYLTVHFMAKETFDFKTLNSKEIDDLINKLLSQIDITFNTNIANNTELYKNLYSHLYPLIIRIKFNIKTKNPLLEDIKKNMPFSYSIAKYAGNILNEKFNKIISDDEIAYLAVIFEMGIEYNKIPQNNILIVCPTGRGTSKFLKYMYKKLFGEYIYNIDTCGIRNLEYINLKKYDYVFSITNIENDYGVKINKVNCFLDNSERIYIENLLKGYKNFEDSVFDKNLFIVLNGKPDKNEVLKIMSENIVKHTNVKFDIYNSVLMREKLGYTEMFNGVVLTHPLDSGHGLKKICVGVLKNPIKWDKNFVKIVLLICIDNLDNKIDEIYLKIGNLIENKAKIEKLVEKPNFENFLDVINDKED